MKLVRPYLRYAPDVNWPWYLAISETNDVWVLHGFARNGSDAYNISLLTVGVLHLPDPKQTQRERFEQTARELGVDLDEETLKEALRKIAPAPKDRRSAPTKKDA